LPYNTKSIKKDVDNNPIPQYYNLDTDEYEPLQGQAGASKAILQNSNGEEIPINAETFTTPIVEKLNQLAGTVIDESTRQVNETQRKAAEIQRQNLYLEVQQKLDNGEFVGATGPKGDKGDTGAGIEVLGVLDSEADLPTTAQQGDAYIISNALWIYTTQNQWKQAGAINNEAKLIPIEDAGENFQADNVEDALQEVGSKVNVPKSATEEGYPDVISIPNSAVEGDMKVGIKGQTVQNLVKNGDFSEGTDGWSAYGGALSITNGMMKITGNGSQIGFHAYQTKTDLPQVQENRRYYLRAKAMVDNSVATELRLRLVTTDTGAAFGSKIITSPAYGRWYSLSCIGTVPAGRSGYLSFFVQSLYSDATTANGQSHEVERNSFMCVDMGIDSTNPFYNKTVEQMDSMFAQWTDDLSSTLGSKRVRSLGHELFDMEDLLKIGFKKDANGDYYVDNPNVPFGKVLYENKDRYEGQYTIQINGKYIDTAYPNLPGVLAKVQYTDNTVSSDILLGGYNNFSTVTYTTTPNKTVDFIYFGYGWNNPSYIRDLKIQKGTSISEEPYTEDIAYITAEKDGELQELRNVPNGVADEIRFNADGNGLEYVKRCEKETITGDNVIATRSAMRENTFVIDFSNAINKIPSVTQENNDNAWFIINGIKFKNSTPASLDNQLYWNEPYYYSVANASNYNKYVRFSIPKTDVDWTAVPTMQQVKDYLNAHPITLIYQLLQEEVAVIQWTGLTCKKDGTVLIETIVPEVGFYGTQATTKHPAQLIGSVDRLYKVDRDAGIRTRLDVSKCVITTGKLGFTHPDLADGDLLDWDYVPETSYTQGYKSITVPTNMSATVEGLVGNSKVQKENIRQLEYKVETAGKVQSVNGKTGEVEITKNDVGLDNVDNTADADKPVSTAQQTALNNKVTLRGDVMLGTLGLKGHYEKWISAGSDGYMSTSTYNVFYHTPTADTTYSFGAPGVTTGMYRAILKITMGTTAYALSWPTKVKWDKGVTPEALGANKTAVLSFMTFDNGATWYGKELWRES
jgi:hypothetical protein